MTLPNGIQLLVMFMIFVIPILTLMHIYKSNFKSCNVKVSWAILVVITLTLGSILYFIFGFRQTIKKEKNNS